MELIDYLPVRDIEFAKHRLKESSIPGYEKIMQVTFGDQLKAYILKLGYIAYRHIELYGINADQGVESDMVKTTKRLHKSFPFLKGLIAIENQGDGDYYFVDQNDRIYRYVIGTDAPVELKMDLNDYIISRMYI